MPERILWPDVDLCESVSKIKVSEGVFFNAGFNQLSHIYLIIEEIKNQTNKP